MNIINFIVFLFYAITLAFVLVRLFILIQRNKNLVALLIQARIDNAIYVDRLAKEINQKESVKVEQTEGFLNFVSQSRDYAFEYIENVQDKIKDVFSFVDNKTQKKTVKQILEVVESLREMLPEERENKNG